MRKIVRYFLFSVSLLCILYYTIKYYYENNLSFDKSNILGWTIVVFIIVVCLSIGIRNSIRLDKVLIQNKELIDKVSELSKTIEAYHYSEMSNVNSVMECVLDLDKS